MDSGLVVVCLTKQGVEVGRNAAEPSLGVSDGLDHKLGLWSCALNEQAIYIGRHPDD